MLFTIKEILCNNNFTFLHTIKYEMMNVTHLNRFKLIQCVSNLILKALHFLLQYIFRYRWWGCATLVQCYYSLRSTRAIIGHFPTDIACRISEDHWRNAKSPATHWSSIEGKVWHRQRTWIEQWRRNFSRWTINLGWRRSRVKSYSNCLLRFCVNFINIYLTCLNEWIDSSVRFCWVKCHSLL